MTALTARRTWIHGAVLAVLTLAALAAGSGSARAADIVLVPGAAPTHMSALDGWVVWIEGKGPSNTLMQRDTGGTVQLVAGAPTASYRSLDLGRNVRGDLVLTYLRCTAPKRCTAYSDDLNGHRTAFKRLVPKRCELTGAPSRWRERVAYGLRCTKLRPKPYEQNHDDRRSGLYVRRGARPAKRLPLPDPAEHEYGYGVDVRRVDLRGTDVGAVVLHPEPYTAYTTYTQTVDGARLRSTSAGYGGEDSPGPGVGIMALSLGAHGRLWTLHGSTAFGGMPPTAGVDRGLRCAGGGLRCADGSGCVDGREAFSHPAGTSQGAGYPVESMAVHGDTIFGDTLYLSVPGTGIVIHEFAPLAGFGCE